MQKKNRLMAPIPIQRYFPQAEPLKKLVKYYWVLDSVRSITLNHKILPVNNIDILFNFLSPMTFEIGGVTHETPGNIYFSGLSGQHALMKQQGAVLTIGVSFFPAGFYPFFKIPVSKFRNDTLGLGTLLNHAAVDLEEMIREASHISDKIMLIEHFLLGQLDQNAMIPDDTIMLLNEFHASKMGVRDFCRRHGVYPRKLERLFNKYVGVTPKQFFRLSRFQIVLNQLMCAPRACLTNMAYEFDYYDQTHFIKDFKSYTGSSPSKFLKEKRSFKQIMEIQ